MDTDDLKLYKRLDKFVGFRTNISFNYVDAYGDVYSLYDR